MSAPDGRDAPEVTRRPRLRRPDGHWLCGAHGVSITEAPRIYSGKARP